MADKKITELTENTTPAVTDLLVIEDDPAGTPNTQKIELKNLFLVINGLTEDASPSSSDYLLTYDVSASGVKKTLVSSLPISGGGGGGGGTADTESIVTTIWAYGV